MKPSKLNISQAISINDSFSCLCIITIDNTSVNLLYNKLYVVLTTCLNLHKPNETTTLHLMTILVVLFYHTQLHKFCVQSFIAYPPLLLGTHVDSQTTSHLDYPSNNPTS